MSQASDSLPPSDHRVPDTAEKPVAGAANPPMRIWPAVALLLGIVLARYATVIVPDGPSMMWMVPSFAPLLLGLLFLLVWFFIGRATWSERVVGILGVVGLAIAIGLLVHPSMLGPGLMVMTLPLGMAAFALGTIIFGRSGSPQRIYWILGVALIGFGASLLVRSDGVWGDFALDLQTRWSPDAEQRLAARRDSGEFAKSINAMSDVDAGLADPAWPSFRGSDRQSRVQGPKLSTDWEKNPPRQLWKIPVGPAWSSFVVAGKLLFTQEQRGDAETIVCYDADSGREVWSQSATDRFDDPLGGPGPRATPTLHQGHLFVMGAGGLVMRLEPKSGEIVWTQDLRKLAERDPPMWGFSSSPLVVDDKVIVYAGGADDKGLFALDVDTGEVKWNAAAGSQSYASPQLMTIEDQAVVALLDETGLRLFDSGDGSTQLAYTWPHDGYRSLQPYPLDEKSVLIPTGMGSGTRKVQLELTDQKWNGEEIWTSRNLKPDFNDLVVLGDYVYGFDGEIFTCVDVETGQRQWKGGRYGKGQVLAIQSSEMLLVITEFGEIVLVDANPEDHIELAKFQAIEGKTWNHPVLVGDRLYVRNASEAACFELPLAKE